MVYLWLYVECTCVGISSIYLVYHLPPVGFPLTVLGGIMGKNMASGFDAPCRTKNIAREIPSAPWYRSLPVHMAIGGFLPFRCVATVWCHMMSHNLCDVIHFISCHFLHGLWCHTHHWLFCMMSCNVYYFCDVKHTLNFPCSAISVELYYIFANVWGREPYTLYGILFVVFFILISVTACISVALTYFQLSTEDYRWWWKAVFSSGCVCYCCIP